MAQPPARRCAIWVDTATFMSAQNLAELAGVDVDSFIEAVVKGLHAQEREDVLLHLPRSQLPRQSSASRRSGGGADVGLAKSSNGVTGPGWGRRAR
jgi:hypothetical protein